MPEWIIEIFKVGRINGKIQIGWTDLGEGPFGSWEQAQAYADAEVGVRIWRVQRKDLAGSSNRLAS